MKNLFNSKFLILILSSFLFLQSCKDDDKDQLPQYNTGILVCNEGVFGSGTGTITHYDPNTENVTQDVFNKVNGFALGNILQSVNEADGKLYWVVNNANKIEVTDASTLKSTGVIEGIPFPRYMTTREGMGYVTSFGDDFVSGKVYIVDLLNSTLINSINVGYAPEQLLLVGNKLYVALSGFGEENKVVVIDLPSMTIENSIRVGAGPTDLVFNGADKIWVLCSGKWKSDFSELELHGTLFYIDIATQEAVLSQEFFSGFSQPSNLIVGPDKSLYFGFEGETYKITPDGNSFALINKEFYSLGIDGQGRLLAGDAGNYVDPGTVYIYDASNGDELGSFQSGIIPTFFLSR